jgi:hypothetical protein
MGGASQDVSDEEMNSCQIWPTDHPPEAPAPMLAIGDKIVATPGNLIALSAQAKSLKSNFAMGLVASILAKSVIGLDAEIIGPLGLAVKVRRAGAVLTFDTEQSKYQAWKLADKAWHRASGGPKGSAAGAFHSYSIVSIALAKRLRFIEAAMERAKAACGAVNFVSIDGVGDLCANVLDSDESVALVGKLQKLALKFSCVILCVLHENPGAGDTGKTRGHLGSELERKAESNLRLKRLGDNTTFELFAPRCRHGSILAGEGLLLEFDVEKQWVHAVDRGPYELDQLKSNLTENGFDFRAVFGGEERSTAQLITSIMEQWGGSERSAQRDIEKWCHKGLIQKVSRGKYVLAP